jgi:hypothetical protein
VAEVDDDQLAALRRLRAAFGFVEVVEVVGHDQVVSDHKRMIGQGTQGSLRGGEDDGPAADDPEEHGEAHALLVKAVTDPDWHAANKDLDELMRKLIVIHRLLEAEERLPKREPWTDPM